MITSHAFRKLLLQCFNGVVPRRIMIALSGGVDSMCLTKLLCNYRKEYDPLLQIHALTIDHGYRKGSSEEARSIGEIVRGWGVAHNIKRLEYNKPLSSITNFEEVARGLRYKAFQEACNEKEITSLLVAHNLEDQIETYLLRLLMNSTLFGLNGLSHAAAFPLPPNGPLKDTTPITVHRPLLDFEKKYLIDTCISQNVHWFEDYTNADSSLTRRNLLRYLVNTYVPESYPHLSGVVGKNELINTITEIKSLVEDTKLSMNRFDELVKENGEFNFNKRKTMITFKLNLGIFHQTDSLTFSRWLYELMYPLSPSTNYHWSYAKIERQAYPKILEFFADNRSTLFTGTYLGVKIHGKKMLNNSVRFTLSQQPLIRSSIDSRTIQLEATTELLDWVLFNHTWWIRLQSHLHKTVKIRPYSILDKRKRTPGILSRCTDEPFNVPIISDSRTNEVLSCPTADISAKSIRVECLMKE